MTNHVAIIWDNAFIYNVPEYNSEFIDLNKSLFSFTMKSDTRNLPFNSNNTYLLVNIKQVRGYFVIDKSVIKIQYNLLDLVEYFNL